VPKIAFYIYSREIDDLEVIAVVKNVIILSTVMCTW